MDKTGGWGDVRGDVHGGELPVGVLVDGLVFFGSEPDVDDGEDTRPGSCELVIGSSMRRSIRLHLTRIRS